MHIVAEGGRLFAQGRGLSQGLLHSGTLLRRHGGMRQHGQHARRLRQLGIEHFLDFDAGIGIAAPAHDTQRHGEQDQERTENAAADGSHHAGSMR